MHRKMQTQKTYSYNVLNTQYRRASFNLIVFTSFSNGKNTEIESVHILYTFCAILCTMYSFYTILCLPIEGYANIAVALLMNYRREQI